MYELPTTLAVATSIEHARSMQTSTAAPVTPDAFCQVNVGDCVVVTDADMGRSGRGGAMSHTAPLTTNPAAHVKPHVAPLQVAVPFAGAVHGASPHVPPHVVSAELLAQVFPQAW